MFVVGLAVLLSGFGGTAQAKKIALVIGNAAYPGTEIPVARQATVPIFYFSGRAVQNDGKAAILPVGAAKTGQTLSPLMAPKSHGTHLIIQDAKRAGLPHRLIDQPAKRYLIAFSASADGWYAQDLSRTLFQPGLDIEWVFLRLRQRFARSGFRALWSTPRVSAAAYRS